MNYKILPPPGQSRRIKRRGVTQRDTIQVMKKVAKESAAHPYFKTLVKRYNLNNDLRGLKKVFDFAFYNTWFKSDDDETQTIRSGLRSINDTRANCVDYCILISSFFLNMGVPHKFRMISTDPENPKNLSHIYVITPFGVLDPVLGQDQSGKEINKIRSQRTPHFLREAPYVSKIDLRIF